MPMQKLVSHHTCSKRTCRVWFWLAQRQELATPASFTYKGI